MTIFRSLSYLFVLMCFVTNCSQRLANLPFLHCLLKSICVPKQKTRNNPDTQSRYLDKSCFQVTRTIVLSRCSVASPSPNSAETSVYIQIYYIPQRCNSLRKVSIIPTRIHYTIYHKARIPILRSKNRKFIFTAWVAW